MLIPFRFAPAHWAATVSLGILAGAFTFAQAQNGSRKDHWVATWATAQEFIRPASPVTQQAARFPRPVPAIDNQTVRMIIRTSLGGRRVRVQLANSFESAAVTVGAAHVAIRSKDSAIVPASDRVVTFSRNPGFTIPPGAMIVSDPVDLDVPRLTDLAVSLYLPGENNAPAKHMFGLHTTYISKTGNCTGQTQFDEATTTTSYFWLSSVHVLAPAETGAIVAFGDSITDGDQSTPDSNRMWPAVLASRLLSNKATARLALVNEGIAGNRVLSDAGAIGGTSALSRFDRDVLNLPGVEWVVFLEGINDIGALSRPGPSGKALTVGDLIAGQRQVVEMAHLHGIRVAGCTLTPRQGGGRGSEAGEAIRQALNDWIRNGGEFDAVIDFDAAVRDPQDPVRFREDLHADSVHPNDAGYSAMANFVDLSIFTRKSAPEGSRRGTSGHGAVLQRTPPNR